MVMASGKRDGETASRVLSRLTHRRARPSDRSFLQLEGSSQVLANKKGGPPPTFPVGKLASRSIDHFAAPRKDEHVGVSRCHFGTPPPPCPRPAVAPSWQRTCLRKRRMMDGSGARGSAGALDTASRQTDVEQERHWNRKDTGTGKTLEQERHWDSVKGHRSERGGAREGEYRWHNRHLASSAS